MKMAKIMGPVFCGLLFVGAVVAQTTRQQIAASECPTCDCYYSSDCSSGKTCGGYGNCTASGKLDGTCSGGSEEIFSKGPLDKKLLPTPKQDPAAVYAAVDTYFQAFIKAVNRGGGVPDQKLLATAQKAAATEAGRRDVEYAVWVSMDAVMGWDFMYPNDLQRASGFVGNIREVHGVAAASGIVDAARRGILDAIQSGDATKVAGPLQEFWSKNPNFIPRHLGRCYPHGHAEVTDSKSATACQIDTLQRVATILIKKTRDENKTASQSTSAPTVGADAANTGETGGYLGKER